MTLDCCRHSCNGVRDFVHPLWAILGLFTTTVPSEANLGIKLLVLNSFGSEGCEFDAVVDLVKRNTTLEILEMGASITQLRNTIPRGLGKALGCNRALKEIRFRLGSAVDFKELVLLLVPDANGHLANTTLSTLELSLVSFYASPLDYMTDLAKLVASNSTLTDVRSWHTSMILHSGNPVFRNRWWRCRSCEVSWRGWPTKHKLAVSERRKWELHLGKGTQEWRMTYTGPCLAREFGECPPALIIWVKAFLGRCWWWLLWMKRHV